MCNPIRRLKIWYYFIIGYYQECRSCGVPIISPIRFNTTFKFYCYCKSCRGHDLESQFDSISCPEI